MKSSHFTNQYQLNKTIRFGLTQKEKLRKENYNGQIYQSHTTLRDGVIESEQLIRESLKNNSNTTLPVQKVRDCIDAIKLYVKTWNEIYSREDQIALTKEYYAVIARKARFDAFWKNRGDVKQPQSQIVKLSSLKSKYNGEARSQYLIDYWTNNTRIIKKRLFDFEQVIYQFENAIKDNRTDRRLNEVDFRKMFLSICKLVNESLVPLCNSSICFPDLEKLIDNEENERLRDFVLMGTYQLTEQIEELKVYFGENGGYVPYGRATLNKYTALQKAHRFDDEIKKTLDDIRLLDVIKKLSKQDDVCDYFENLSDKIERLFNDEVSVVERVQLFKYKPIPLSVRFALTEYLNRECHLEKDKLRIIFDILGKPKSPAKDYADLQDKSDFNLYQYPLKVAFDFSWESLAKAQYHKGIYFPEIQCKEFLKNVFDVDPTDTSLNTYARLLHLRELLATLDHGKPADRQGFIDRATALIKEAGFPKVSLKGSKDDSANKAVLSWLSLSEEEQAHEKITKGSSYNQYEKAKNKIGLYRGEQKNKIKKYYKLTEKFKELSSEFGKMFATLREAFQAESELNKVTHYSTIIEDGNHDRYMLLYPLTEQTTNLDHLFTHEESGTLTSYYVKSLTSKTLNKLLKNKGGFKDFHLEGSQPNWEKVKRNWSTYKDDNVLLAYIKRCLGESKMARTQNWAEFNWNFSSCTKFEDIEREIDKKGYLLKSNRKLSVETVKGLIKDKNCLLLPIINQDISVEEPKLRNQFSKDWAKLFDASCNEYRLHPEFRISYRMPTPNYPKPEQKRYSRFQMIGHFHCEIVPATAEYLSKKEQIAIFNDTKEQQKVVDTFNTKVKNVIADDYVIIGVDRGLKQLATLCVLDKDGVIQGDFNIYTRTFNGDKKQWEHQFVETRHILDLSNLRVETTVAGEKALVDLSLIKVKDREGNYTQDNQQKIKLKQLAYIRKLQYQMQIAPENVKAFSKKHKTPDEIENNIRELITPYKEGKYFADLPSERITQMLEAFYVAYTEGNKVDLRELIELDAADDLKSGVVGNIVGVIAHILERYDYKAYISLENLTRAFYDQKDGLSGEEVSRDTDFMDQENLVLAGLGTYHYLEVQLLRKFFRLQNETEIINLVPAFRSNDNYETIRKLTQKKDGVEYVCKPFGIVHFVDPKYTSKKCPACGNHSVVRTDKEDAVKCKSQKCEYSTALDDDSKNEKLMAHGKTDKNIHRIGNGDENGAYHIALKTLQNLANSSGDNNRSMNPAI